MKTQQSIPLTREAISNLNRQECVNLLLTATSPAEIDHIEDLHSYRIKTFPELRVALYEVARQNARYRRALAPNDLLPDMDAYTLTILDMQELLTRTADVKMVDLVEELTEGRLRRLPDFRHGLFEIAKQAITYRSASHLLEV